MYRYDDIDYGSLFLSKLEECNIEIKNNLKQKCFARLPNNSKVLQTLKNCHLLFACSSQGLNLIKFPLEFSEIDNPES